MRRREQRRAVRDAVAALLLAFFALASTASPNLSAARSFERVVRVARHAAALREARTSAADRTFVADRPTVSVRATPREVGGRDRCHPPGPMLPVAVVPAVGGAVVASESDFVAAASLTSASPCSLARARGPPISG
jgi:hypothetical protein